MRIFAQLRAGALLVALMLLAYSASTSAPARALGGAQLMLADAGASLSAGVPENPYNTLAVQLAQKEQELNARQANLNNAQSSGSGSPDWGLYSLYTSGALFVLVAANFFFDVRRSQRGTSKKFSIDLR